MENVQVPGIRDRIQAMSKQQPAMLQKSVTVGYVQPYRYPSPNIPLSAIKRLARQIGEKFRPQKIVLFGSYAYGTPHAESDVDLLVIMPTRNVIDQAVRICREFERPFSLDLIVRTPRQIELGLRPDDCDWFLREVIEKGKVLYEASHSSVGSQIGRRSRRGADTGGLKSPAKGFGVLSLPAGGGKIPQGALAGTRCRRATNTRPGRPS